MTYSSFACVLYFPLCEANISCSSCKNEKEYHKEKRFNISYYFLRLGLELPFAADIIKCPSFDVTKSSRFFFSRRPIKKYR